MLGVVIRELIEACERALRCSRRHAVLCGMSKSVSQHCTSPGGGRVSGGTNWARNARQPAGQCRSEKKYTASHHLVSDQIACASDDRSRLLASLEQLPGGSRRLCDEQAYQYRSKATDEQVERRKFSSENRV